MTRIFIIFQLLFVGCALAHDSFEPKVELTQSEVNFIKNHPEVTLAGGVSFEPFLIPEPDGSVTGYDADIARLISEATGLKIKFELDVWAEITERAKNREFDGLSTSGDHQKRSSYFNNSIPYITLTRIVFVPKGNPKQIRSLQDLKGKAVALQRGNLLFESLIENSEIMYFDTISEMIEAVSSGRADYTVYDESIHYIGRKLGLMSTLQPMFTVGSPFNVVFALRNDMPELKSIIDKGILSISSEQIIKIRDKWFGHLEVESSVQLSDEELVFLSNKSHLSYCINPNIPPIEYLDEGGNHQGISRDIVDLLSEKLGEPISLVKTDNWQDSLNGVASGRCDFIPLISPSSALSYNLKTTSSIFPNSMVVVTSNNHSFIKDMDAFSDKSYAVRADFIEPSQIKTYYPDAKIFPVPTLEAGLRKVKEGDVFGYIDLVEPVIFNSNRLGEMNIQVSAQLPWKHEFVMALRANDPHLHTVLSKAIESITKSDIKKIESKWMTTKYESIIDYNSIITITSIALIIIGAISFLYQRLRLEKNKADLLLSNLHDVKLELEAKNKQLIQLSTTDQLTKVFNRLKLDEVLIREIQRAHRYKRALGIIIIDVDHFKKVNDTYGHLVGDEVLTHIADSMTNNIRPSDTLGRWGGEEFLIICPETEKKELESLAERLRKNIEISKCNAEVEVTISLGLTRYISGDDEKDMIKRADDALYTAKTNGRNQYQFL